MMPPDSSSYCDMEMVRAAVAALEEFRREQVCPYAGKTCDCKYGKTMLELGGSERTGCPELREIVGLLNDALRTPEERAERLEQVRSALAASSLNKTPNAAKDET